MTSPTAWHDDFWFQCRACDWGDCTGEEGCKGNELTARIAELEYVAQINSDETKILVAELEARIATANKERDAAYARIAELGAQVKWLSGERLNAHIVIDRCEDDIEHLEALLRRMSSESG